MGTFRFPAVEPGDYHLQVVASGYFPARYDLRLRPRQTLSLSIELFPHRLGDDEYVEVQADYTGLDPSQTTSSRFLTQQSLQEIPVPLARDLPTLAENVLPGAMVGHDNFVHVRGNELSLHQYINGVSSLDNTHYHFTSGLSPRILESANFITGGFPAEFGNRFGGVVDTTTRSGRGQKGHGSVRLGAGTVLNHDMEVDYGGSAGRWGYFFFVSGFESGRFLNPPTEREIHDLGYGSQGAVQLDYAGKGDVFKLVLIGGGTNFELPNTEGEAALGRDAFRRIRSQTAILTWGHEFSPFTFVTSSLYEHDVSDRLLGTTDLETPFGEGSRSTLTVGAKTDWTIARHGHTIKAGLDVSRLSLRENFFLDPREHEDDGHDDGHGDDVNHTRASDSRLFGQDLHELPFRFSSVALDSFSFRGRDLGGEIGLYVQDRFSLFRHFTIEAGLRWDQIDLVRTESRVSPRLAVAYHSPQINSVIHFAYNRLFTPPPLEYVVLASYLGSVLSGGVRAYTQDYYEVGWNQQLHSKFSAEFSAYHHRGENAFETAEISNTRLFLPMNFQGARASGAEFSLILSHLERLGLQGRFQYGAARVHFFGPVSGGFSGGDLHHEGRILPAFDQTHTGTASIFYRNPRNTSGRGSTFATAAALRWRKRCTSTERYRNRWFAFPNTLPPTSLPDSPYGRRIPKG